MRILVVNMGSSSLKLRVLDEGDKVVAGRDLAAPGGALDEGALSMALAGFGAVGAVGHRIVHGGHRYAEPVLLSDEVEAELRTLIDLAPLHQANALATFSAVRRALPAIPQVACFDTAFHAHLDAAAATYAIPAEWREDGVVRRYGFHGLSHAYASRRAAAMVDRGQEDLKVVTCHLGAGASLAAVKGGRSVDTTMGFTPLEGLVMATRSGDVDPGLLLWLQRSRGRSAEEILDGLEHRSGLLALAGTSNMAEVIQAERRGEERATLALAVYLHRLRGLIASMTAALGGLDVLVFTGGVGENAPAVRAGAAASLGFLGIIVNPESNAAARADADITSEGATVKTLVIEAREDLEIARGVRMVSAHA